MGSFSSSTTLNSIGMSLRRRTVCVNAERWERARAESAKLVGKKLKSARARVAVMFEAAKCNNLSENGCSLPHVNRNFPGLKV